MGAAGTCGSCDEKPTVNANVWMVLGRRSAVERRARWLLPSSPCEARGYLTARRARCGAAVLACEDAGRQVLAFPLDELCPVCQVGVDNTPARVRICSKRASAKVGGGDEVGDGQVAEREMPLWQWTRTACSTRCPAG